MMMVAKDVTDDMISEMFRNYVASTEDKERHTEMACKEVDAYDRFCEEVFPGNARMQSESYDKMMNAAVEFEESGFIAGARWMLMLIQGKELHIEPLPTIPPLDAEQSQQEAVNASKEDAMLVDTANTDCITTKQIAEMFETTNFKVVRRIEKQILPYLDTESKKYFDKVEGRNVQHKPITFYRLNKAACQLYLKEIEPKRKNFINIAGGYAKLQELMELVFPAEVRAVTV